MKVKEGRMEARKGPSENRRKAGVVTGCGCAEWKGEALEGAGFVVNRREMGRGFG